MYLLVAVSALLSQFSFPGGSTLDFCNKLSDTTHRASSVMLGSSSDSVRAGQITSPALTDVRRLAAVKFGFDTRPKGEVLGFGPKGWPRNFFQRAETAKYLEGFQLDARSVVRKDGTLTVRQKPGTCLSLGALAKRVSSKLTWAPFFENTRFVLSCESVPEEQALEAVAAAVGGVLSKKMGGYSVDLDGPTMRRRIIAMGRGPVTETNSVIRKMEMSNGEFLATIAENLTDAELLSFFYGSKDWVVKPAAPGTALHNAAIVRLRALIEFYTPGPGHSVSGTIIPQLKSAQLDKQILVEINANGLPVCTFQSRTGTYFSL